MEEHFTVTQSELEEAFKKWNAYYLENKGEQEFPDIGDQSHIGQAANLIEFLGEG